MSKSIGIDLGTTNSVGEVKRVQTEIIKNSEGDQITPSCVAIRKRKLPLFNLSVVVGKDALEWMKQNPENTVIAVPAYFNDKQKHATRTAAALAGLKVQRLLPEPTAAAISFGVDTVKGDEATTVLVFDFRSGTFDLSVLTISGGQFIEQGKEGDMWLGGEDLDPLLMDHVMAELAREYNIDDMKVFLEWQNTNDRHRFRGELKSAVEKAKVLLSSENESYIEILGVLKDDDGDLIDVDVEITKDQFEEMVAPMVDDLIRLTRKTLEDNQVLSGFGGYYEEVWRRGGPRGIGSDNRHHARGR